jgi:hypothetical protein
MSEPTNDPPPEAVQQSAVAGRSERIRVRKRVKIRSASAKRADNRKLMDNVIRVVLYVSMCLGSLVMIWFGLKVFVKPPAPESWRALPVTRSLA